MIVGGAPTVTVGVTRDHAGGRIDAQSARETGCRPGERRHTVRRDDRSARVVWPTVQFESVAGPLMFTGAAIVR